MRVDELNYDTLLSNVVRWVDEASSRYICISNAHMIMESYDDPIFRTLVNEADLVAADGVPIIWLSKWLGLSAQERLFAPELMVRLCGFAAKNSVAVGFYGSTGTVINDLASNLARSLPDLQIGFAYAPPFRPQTHLEDGEVIDRINASGIGILFVGLGCPKQERWMSEHRGRVNATMLGVGWAFDVLSGHSKAAPNWIQRIGMEWAFRLALNPRRLWKRHFKHYPRFVWLVASQLISDFAKR